MFVLPPLFGFQNFKRHGQKNTLCTGNTKLIIEVDRIEADSGDTYGCQPNPGLAAEVKVHVIKEGTFKIVNVTFIFKTNYFRYNAHCTEYELTTPAI